MPSSLVCSVNDKPSYQPSRFQLQSQVSQAVISILRFLAAVANSHRLGAKTHGFVPPNSRLVISHGFRLMDETFFFGLHLAQAAVP